MRVRVRCKLISCELWNVRPWLGLLLLCCIITDHTGVEKEVRFRVFLVSCHGSRLQGPHVCRYLIPPIYVVYI
jgi:hypothetical protein